MARTVSRLYDTYGDAQRAVNALEAAGFTASEIGMVSRYRDDETPADTTSGAATGAAAGAVVGGGAGLLAALGVIAIPGIGPLVAAGILATTVVGAAGGGAVGGLLGALTDYGVSEEDAHHRPARYQVLLGMIQVREFLRLVNSVHLHHPRLHPLFSRNR